MTFNYRKNAFAAEVLLDKTEKILYNYNLIIWRIVAVIGSSPVFNNFREC